MDFTQHGSVDNLIKSSFSGVVVTKSHDNTLIRELSGEQAVNISQSLKELCFKRLLSNVKKTGDRGVFNDRTAQFYFSPFGNNLT